MDLNQYDLKELLELRRRIDLEIHTRHDADPQTVRGQLRSLAQQWGYALTEIMTGLGNPTDPRPPESRFSHPEHPGLTWNGRGHMPDWVREWEASGRSVDELRTKN